MKNNTENVYAFRLLRSLRPLPVSSNTWYQHWRPVTRRLPSVCQRPVSQEVLINHPHHDRNVRFYYRPEWGIGVIECDRGQLGLNV